MKTALGIILFLSVFALAGVVIHFAIFGQLGIYIWSVDADRGLVQTKLERRGVEVVSVPMAMADPPQKTLSDEGAEKKPTVGEMGRENAEPEVSAEEEVPEEKSAESEAPPSDPDRIVLFDGKELGAWEITRYGGEGDVFVTADGELEFGFGAILTGVHWGGEVPRSSNFEISLEAMKLDGNDFFCALTYPVKERHATFVVGGWGGGVVGISSVDELDASENETMSIEGFDDDVWYRIRVRVTDDRIEAWIDDENKVDLALEGREIDLRPGDIELSVPIGLASYQTRARFRNIVWQNLPRAE